MPQFPGATALDANKPSHYLAIKKPGSSSTFGKDTARPQKKLLRRLCRT